jgi:uncharacterized protein with NRDE domain
MCTVTFAPTKNGFVMTSSRDEHIARGATFEPQTYQFGTKKISFPKDEKAAGTWFGISSANEIMVLFNGGFVNHVRAQSYRKSRGLIFLALLSQADVLAAWAAIDLENIEPFSLIYLGNEQLHKLTWTGEEKNLQALDTKKSYIWSSASLYTAEQAQARQAWFAAFEAENTAATAEDILNFHSQTAAENKDFGLQIDRPNGMKTQSITQAILADDAINLTYWQLDINKISTINSAPHHAN